MSAPERTIDEIRERRTDGRRGDDHRRVEKRMETFRRHPRGDEDGEDHREDRGTEEMAKIHRYGDGIAAGFAQRRGQDLDDQKPSVTAGTLLTSAAAAVSSTGSMRSLLRWFADDGPSHRRRMDGA